MVPLKKEILSAGIQKHRAVVDDYRVRIKEMMTADENLNEGEYDSHGSSHKEEIVAEVSLLSDQLHLANHELDELRKIESFVDRAHEMVEFGTVVTTDKGTFFVAAPIEPFSVQGQTVSGLSVQSPLYKCMKGRSVGESFNYGPTRYFIEEIW